MRRNCLRHFPCVFLGFVMPWRTLNDQLLVAKLLKAVLNAPFFTNRTYEQLSVFSRFHAQRKNAHQPCTVHIWLLPLFTVVCIANGSIYALEQFYWHSPINRKITAHSHTQHCMHFTTCVSALFILIPDKNRKTKHNHKHNNTIILQSNFTAVV